MGEQEIGFAAIAIAVLFFGSNFVPVKKFETGDGIFFQWILCSAVWMTGLIVNLIRTNYSTGLISSIAFYPYAMLGGAVWCIGNSMVVTIIKCIGLGLGMCLWGSANLVMGWASGSFGLFGLHRETVSNPILNYLGACVAVFAVLVFSLIKPEEQKQEKKVNVHSISEEERFLLSDPYRVSVNQKEVDEKSSESFIDSLSPSRRRMLGVSLSILSGFFLWNKF